MRPFAETSFLCSLYRGDVFSVRTDEWVAAWGRPLPLSSLVRFEFRQSLRLQTRLHVSNPELGIPRDTARKILRHAEEDERRGVLELLPLDWAAVHERAERLSDKYTWEEAHRFADILHVATALHLCRDTFLTYDDRQARMARGEGLDVPLGVC